MSSACEKAISKIEKELESERQQKFGRDQNAKYDGFNEGSESCVSRVIRTACDIVIQEGIRNQNVVFSGQLLSQILILISREIDLTAFLRQLLL